jgi:glucose/arabinose dehydrogenase
MTGARLILILILLMTLMLLPALQSASAIPAGFTDSVLARGLDLPTAMEFAPDGRLFVTEKDGDVRIIKNGALLSTPFVTIPVDTFGERGLLGIAFDPNFASNRYVYVYYTTSTDPIHNRVSRFTADTASPDRALAGSERVLLELTGSNNGFHNGGAIHFGKDGKLYVASGDHGGYNNPQSLSSYFGKILRINADGTVPTDNPFYNTANAKKEIWALGLRNPFTFAFSPSSTGPQMYINDVGADAWEEINAGSAGANYGWPTCEGSCSNSSFVNPVHSYAHPSDGGRSIAGGAFYHASQFPSEYSGSYFFGDYVAGFIKRLTPGNQVVDFITNASSPVDIKVGQDGSLYYLSIGSGEVHKVQYSSGGNSAPNAIASGSPASGAAPLTVNFGGSGSTDPNGDTLTYSWNFGDGTSASGVTTSHTYGSAGPYTATLTVSDGRGGTDTATVAVTVGTPPAATISTPAAGAKYSAGNIISFSGTATDAQDGDMPASAFRWTVMFHHNTHTHPFKEFSGVKSGSFAIPTTGETESDVWYRIQLTVTDSSGLGHTATGDITPNKSNITLASNPPGLQVYLDSQPRITPYSFTGVVGMTRTLQAPATQTLDGQTYQFQSWSDGGTATHSIGTPAASTTYTANYALASPSGGYDLTVRSVDLSGSALTGYYTVIQSGGSAVQTGYTPLAYGGSAGGTYSVTVHDYSSVVFDHWDNGSTSRTRTLTLNSDTMITAYYRTPNSQPTWTLTVRSQDASGSAVTGFWATLYGSSGSAIASGYTPATFTLNTGQQYSVSVADYGTHTFDHWADNGSTANPRGVSIAANTQLVAVYGQDQTVHMQNTATSWGSLQYSGRQINAQYVTPGSQLVGDKIDSITLQLMKHGSPTGTAQVGIFNENLTVKKLFGTVDVSTLAASYQDYEFKLADSELYTIQAGDRIGIKYSTGNSTNGVYVMIDRDIASSFDGTSSQRIRYESGWLYYDTGEDMYMILKQTHG